MNLEVFFYVTATAYWRNIPGNYIGISDFSAGGGISYTAIKYLSLVWDVPKKKHIKILEFSPEKDLGVLVDSKLTMT